MNRRKSKSTKAWVNMRVLIGTLAIAVVFTLWFQFASYASFTSRNRGNASSASSSSPSSPQDRRQGRVFSWSNFKKAKDIKGSFSFQDSKACVESPCRIHFPSKMSDPENPDCDMGCCARTKKGFKPPLPGEEVAPGGGRNIPNQDRSLMVHPLAISMPTGVVEKDCALLLLADGHGPLGHVTAAAVQRDLPMRILNMLEATAAARDQSAWNIPELLRRAFVDCDKEVAIDAARLSGTTTIVVLKIGSTVYIASVGDSTVVLVQRQPTTDNNAGFIYQIVARAEPHKPHMPTERKRIEGLNGRVFIPFSFDNGETSRVILPGVSSNGVPMEMALAMSRSLGDKDGKTPGWLSAEPSVIAMPLSKAPDLSYFALVASDGVTDHHPLDHVIEKSGNALFHEGNSDNAKTTKLGAGMDSILAESANGWATVTNGQYRDDMTLILSRV